MSSRLLTSWRCVGSPRRSHSHFLSQGPILGGLRPLMFARLRRDVREMFAELRDYRDLLRPDDASHL